MANDKTPEELEAEATALAQKEAEDAELLKNQQDKDAEMAKALEDAKAEADKWKKTSENYKAEIESKGLREKKRELPKVETKTTLDEGQLVAFQNDYLSKREDVWDEINPKFTSLKPEEWAKIEHLVVPTLDAIGSKALTVNKFASRVELKRSLEDLIAYAKGNTVDIEKIRLDAIKDKVMADAAEISGTKGSKKTKDSKVTEVDEKYSEASGGLITPESAAMIRLKKEEREKEYSVGIY